MRNSKIKNLVLESLRELKAVNTVTINVRKMSYFTDYLVITTGTSSRHITALSEKVIGKVRYFRDYERLNLLIRSSAALGYSFSLPVRESDGTFDLSRIELKN